MCGVLFFISYSQPGAIQGSDYFTLLLGAVSPKMLIDLAIDSVSNWNAQ